MRFDEDLMEDIKKQAKKSKIEVAKYIRETVRKAVQKEQYNEENEENGEDFNEANGFTNEDRRLLYKTYLHARMAMRKPAKVNQVMMKKADDVIKNEMEKKFGSDQKT